MNLQQCLQILEIENIDSIRDAKRAYKDLVRVWHPDRFQSNPRLKQKAEEKLREINLAFNYLRGYMESIHAGEVSAPQTPPRHSPSGFKSANDPVRSTRHMSEINNHGMTRTPDPQRTASPFTTGRSAPRTSSIGRYVLYAFFFIVAAIGALIVYFLSDSDKITSKTRGMASGAMEKIIDKLDPNQTIQKNDATDQLFIQDLEGETKAERPEGTFEIHLDSGSIIMTERWWEEADMIMYLFEGGSMGIERGRVKKIVKR